MLQKAITQVADQRLKTQILESIQLQASSLATTKHGPKVLQKLQKTYPHIFCASSYEAQAAEAAPTHLQQWQQRARGGPSVQKASAGKGNWNGLSINSCDFVFTQ